LLFRGSRARDEAGAWRIEVQLEPGCRTPRCLTSPERMRAPLPALIVPGYPDTVGQRQLLPEAQVMPSGSPGHARDPGPGCMRSRACQAVARIGYGLHPTSGFCSVRTHLSIISSDELPPIPILSQDSAGCLFSVAARSRDPSRFSHLPHEPNIICCINPWQKHPLCGPTDR
jgi:hypothetical protein